MTQSINDSLIDYIIPELEASWRMTKHNHLKQWSYISASLYLLLQMAVLMDSSYMSAFIDVTALNRIYKSACKTTN